MVFTAVVSTLQKATYIGHNSFFSRQKLVMFPLQLRAQASPEAYSGCRAALRAAFVRQGSSSEATDVMIASLADNTLKQYDPCLKKWYSYCNINQVDFYKATVTQVQTYLLSLFHKGCKYGTINSVKSALTLVLGSEIMNNSVIKRFMRGVYKLRTPLPRYNVTWDPAVVLNHLGNWYPNEGLSFDKLSKKLATLLALVTAHRVQTLSLIRISNIHKISNEKFIIKISDQIKTSAINRLQPTLMLPYFDDRPAICPARTLEYYLCKSAEKRNSNCDFMFISTKRPFNSICLQSLCRWIKETLKESGIDTTIFSAHSTRHASTSAARRLGVSIDLIKKTAGWTGNSEAFARFYNREVSTSSTESFARSLCRSTLSEME